MIKINEIKWMAIDSEFAKIQGEIDIDNYLSPVNRAEELEKFKKRYLNGESYNPLFHYDSLPDIGEKQLDMLKIQLNPENPMENVYIEAIENRQEEAAAARTHYPDIITSFSKRTYGEPNTDLCNAAKHNLDRLSPDQRAYNGEVSGKIYNADELATICRNAMKSYGFHWNVKVVPEMGAKMAVDNLVREFWIRKDVKFHESLVKMMVVHEIGTHVLRSENGYAQPLKLFGRGLPAYQFTEEGLAEYAEERCGVLMDETVYRISGRVIGVHAALNGSFWDTFQAVKPYFDVDMAFDIAQRVKLGFTDTSAHGAYTKDYTYLAGLHRMRSFFDSAGKADIDALFAGKVSFEHLEMVRILQNQGFLCWPKVYPEWFTEI
ncbi:DUF1704 domain-containing protein [bacterium]|nr:DUF1704 domain-containing protein [candidate division CSSED10-310 bacterium]